MTGKLIRNIIFLSVLLLCGIKDMRKKEISLSVAALGLLFGTALLFFDSDMAFYDVFLACLPGVCVMVLSLLSDGKIGFGDGILVLMGGFYFPLYHILQWLFFSFVAAALFGGAMIVLKKAGRKTELPFVPFLFLIAVVLCITGGVS